LTEALVRHILRRGTTLWQVVDRRMPTGLSPAGTSLFSTSVECALIEALLPNPHFTSAGVRDITSEMMADHTVRAFRTTTELVLNVARPATGPGTTSRPGAHGVESYSKRAWPQTQVCLSGAHCPDGALEPLHGLGANLDTPDSLSWLSTILAPYRVNVTTSVRANPLVFLNYRSTAGTEEVYRLDTELRARLGSHAVFRDHKSIEPGRAYPQELLSNVRAAKVLVAIIGKHWETSLQTDGTRALDNSSDWVRRELVEAITHNVKIVPVIVGVREQLRGPGLPEEIRDLAELQFVHLRHRPTDADIAAVVDELLDKVPELRRP
jgi:TIR domain-containing protein